MNKINREDRCWWQQPRPEFWADEDGRTRLHDGQSQQRQRQWTREECVDGSRADLHSSGHTVQQQGWPVQLPNKIQQGVESGQGWDNLSNDVVVLRQQRVRDTGTRRCDHQVRRIMYRNSNKRLDKQDRRLEKRVQATSINEHKTKEAGITSMTWSKARSLCTDCNEEDEDLQQHLDFFYCDVNSVFKGEHTAGRSGR